MGAFRFARSTVCWLGMLLCAAGKAQSPSDSFAVLRGSGASAMELDVLSGRVLEQQGEVDALNAPGSTVKPFLLRSALASGAVTQHTVVHCAGALHVGGRNLACVHPREVTMLDARQALAESCNTYFVELAQRLSSKQIAGTLRNAGFYVAHEPASLPERELTALGLANVRGSVRTLAEAYRGLALWMTVGNADGQTVHDGLLASVESGVAHAARTQDVVLAGKTGTVDVPGPARSHGWFAGVVYDAHGRPERVLVVFVPAGNGRDAAALAHRVLERAP